MKKLRLFISSFVFKKGINDMNRTKTDTGGQVKQTKALERIVLKELGKMTL
jgi:hypothetical protein